MSHDAITPEHVREYRENGVLFLKSILTQEWLDLIELGIRRNLNNPGPYAMRYFEGQPGEFYDDHCNYEANPEYRDPAKPAFANAEAISIWPLTPCSRRIATFGLAPLDT